ncbi:ferredoxin [Acetitomaculum ruminis DSM 5522]|uniref:Ferredoxin n=1 Tax=Acetitomaculum ruminis DSM 5522 TaxID=1120918 RepID=A0A1I0XTI9_9FIRM|nr:ferredoxin [Acetitomaculum ruminis]SFB03498.1 ferredoxin [Acetitomaculum ruminis DSM 5522]
MEFDIKKELCLGCGLCVSICPEVFDMDEESKAHTISKVNRFTYEEADEAMDRCPGKAIYIKSK